MPIARLKPPSFPQIPPPESGRDLALDMVRSWALIVVVFGHFLMTILYWPPGQVPISSNTLSSGEPWPYFTWLFQVMPLFFIAGGAVNAGSWERWHDSDSVRGWSPWVWQRVKRLMRPTLVFLAVMATIFSAVTLVAPTDVTDVLTSGITGPLWFLAVYIPVTALTPLMSKLHRRAPLVTMSVLLVAIVAVDALRLNVSEVFGAVNLLLAWVFVHQLGFFYRDGMKRWMGWVLVGVGLAANIVLTQVLAWYPTSLVGIPTEKFSNMAPPTIILVAHAVTLLGLFLLLAPFIARLMGKRRVLRATAIAGMTAMTLYLWHMAVLVAWLAFLHFMGWQLPTRIEGVVVVPDGLSYWFWLLPSAAVYGLLVWLLVRYLWPLEYVKLPWYDSSPKILSRGNSAGSVGSRVSQMVAGASVVSLSVGLLVVSGAGFSGFPFVMKVAFGVPVNTAMGLVAILLGVVLLRRFSYSRGSGDSS